MQAPQLNRINLKNALANLIIDATLPYTFVERKSFIDLLRVCNPEVPAMLVKADSISEHIIKIYLHIKDQLIIEFGNLTSSLFSLTCDVWTSPNCIAIFGVTCHWINDEWNLKELVISAAELEGVHTGENLAQSLLTALQNFKIDKKIFCITADNASNNKSMGRELEGKLELFSTSHHLLGCFGHVLNLAAKAGLKAFTTNDASVNLTTSLDNRMDLRGMMNDELVTDPGSVLDRIHKVSTHLRLSPQRRAKFAQCVNVTQDDEINGPSCLILDVPTRWNSTLYMLERALLLKKAYMMYVDNETSLRNCKINSDEWSTMEQIIKLLKPLESATVLLSTSQYTSISAVIPTYRCILLRMNQTIATLEGRALVPAAQAIKTKIEKYFSSSLEKPAYVCSMILDPRFKLSNFESTDREYHHCERMFKNEASSYDTYQDPDQVETENHDISVINIYKKRKISNQNLEISSYLKEELEDELMDPLRYWKMKALTYPTLSIMAKTYLAIPATSTPSERAFSQGKRIVDDIRNSLKSERINELMCLNSWKKNGYIELPNAYKT